VREVLKGIRRIVGVAPRQKAPLLVTELRTIVAAIPDDLLGRRDRAILLLGFAGAFRRAELAALTLADLTFGAEGLKITIPRSKTDQEGFRKGDRDPLRLLTRHLPDRGPAGLA
jgi:integrase